MNQEQRQKIMSDPDYAWNLLHNISTFRNNELYELCLRSLGQLETDSLVLVIRSLLSERYVKQPYSPTVIALLGRCIPDEQFAFFALAYAHLDKDSQLYSKAIVTVSKSPYTSAKLLAFDNDLLTSKHAPFLLRAVATDGEASFYFFKRLRYDLIPETKWTETVFKKACNTPLSAKTIMDYTACKDHPEWWRYAVSAAIAEPKFAAWIIWDRKLTYKEQPDLFEKAVMSILSWDVIEALMILQNENIPKLDEELYKRVLKAASETDECLPPDACRSLMTRKLLSPENSNYRQHIRSMFVPDNLID